MHTAITKQNFSHLALQYGDDLHAGVVDLGSVTLKHSSGTEFLVDVDGYSIQEDNKIIANLSLIEEDDMENWDNDFTMTQEQLFSGEVEVLVFVGDDIDCVLPQTITLHLIDSSNNEHSIACKAD